MSIDNREDCYFFLHGGCNKANLCQYRHSEEALKTINVCTEWMESKVCKTEGCPLRHSTYHIVTPLQAQKDPRSEVPCFWEQNGGCKKYHCPYKHSAPNKAGFSQFRPNSINSGSAHYKAGVNSFTPRPQTFSSHHQTLILNNSAPVQTPATKAAPTPAFTSAPPAQPATIVTNPTRPIQPDNSGGIQIKNISNGNGKNTPASGESSKTQISFKSSKPTSETRSQVSVFDRLSNPKDSSDALKPKDVPSKKISKTLPTKSLDNTADPFNDIKVKSLDEILKEKRRKQILNTSNPPSNTPISKPTDKPDVLSVDSPKKQNLLAKAERSSKGASPPSACKESLKRMIDTGIPESKKLKEASVDNLDDFGLEFEDMDYNDADSNLLELDFEQELTEL